MRVGDLQLDGASLELRHSDDMVRISAKPFSLLERLAEQAGHVVPRAELMDSLWPGQVVSDAALGSAVREVRRALKALAVHDRVRLEAVRGRGYRLALAGTVDAPPAVETNEGAVSGAFVGRTAELASLRAALSRPSGAGPHAVLVSGPAGIGKTRLSTEFAEVAARQGYRTLWGRCIEGQSVAFSPWADLLRGFTRSEDASFVRSVLEPAAPELVQVLPSLRAYLSKTGASLPADPELARLALLDGLVGLLTRIAERRGCVYFLEDIHWADGPSLRLLQTLALQRTSDRLLIVATHRDDEPDPDRATASIFTDLERNGVGTRLDLPPLSEDDSVRLLAALGEEPMADERTADLLRIAGGNPFFLEELHRHAATRRASRSLPERIERLVLGRVESRSPKAREVIECAAVIGTVFDGHAASTLANDDGDALDELIGAGLVRASESVGSYRFAHALHRQAIYDHVPPSRRAQLHLRVARNLEESGASPVHDATTLAWTAHHYDQALEAGGREPAYRFRVLAGRDAAARFSFDEATHHLSRAVELLDGAGVPGAIVSVPDEDKCELLSDLARFSRLSGNGASGDRALKAAIPIARRLDDPRYLARCITSAAFFAWEDRELIELHEEALAALGDEATLLRAAVASSLAQRLADSPGAESRREALLAEALDLTAGEDDSRARHFVLEACSTALTSFDAASQREAWADEMVDLGRSMGSPIAETHGLSYRCGVRLNRGDLVGATGDLERLEEIARRHPWPRMEGTVHGHRAVAELIDGRLDSAEEAILCMAEMIGEVGDAQSTAIFGIQLAALRREQGRLGELEGLVDQVVEASPVFSWTKGVLAGELGDRAALEGLLRATFEADDGPRRHGSPVLRTPGTCWLVYACDTLGDATFAAELAGEFQGLEESWPIVGAAAMWTFGSLHRAIGLLELLQQRPSRAVTALERAARSHEQPGAALLRAWTSYDLARALARRERPGDLDRSVRLFDEVEEAARHGGWIELGRRVATAR